MEGEGRERGEGWEGTGGVQEGKKVGTKVGMGAGRDDTVALNLNLFLGSGEKRSRRRDVAYVTPFVCT